MNFVNLYIGYKKNSLKYILIALVSLVFIVFSFPSNDWSYTSNIDGPLSWVYNYFFDGNLSLGEKVIFPHGPLAYVMYPLSNNIISATVFLIVLKSLLICLAFRINDFTKNIKIIFWLILAYFICSIGGVILLLISNLILLYCNYFKYEKRIHKLLAIFLTVCCIYIKSYLAVISVIMFFSFLTYYFIKTKNIKQSLVDMSIFIALLVSFWVIMYHNVTGLVNYLIGLYHLAQDNSTAVSYYPFNNWTFLISAMALLFFMIILNKDSKSKFYFIIVGLSLFASWKHGMAREDIFHYMGFINIVIIILGAFILFTDSIKIINIIISSIIILLLTLNLKNTSDYTEQSYNFFSPNNFIEFVTNFNELKQKSIKQSEINITKNKLPEFVIKEIKNQTVDIYPWDYSIISANKLNWQPRIVIQSYATYTNWLDNKNAEHFKSKKSPDYLIIEKIGASNDSKFNSIDNRLFLNDEPQTLIEILKKYQYNYSNNSFLILKKREQVATVNSKNIKNSTTLFEKWIDVPYAGKELLRVKLNFSKNILTSLKTFLYKDEQYWVYLKLKDNTIATYRIVPKNAESGIWINPFLLGDNKIEEVTQIMFKCSDKNEHEIKLEWEKYNFNNDSTYLESVFNSNTTNKDSLVYTNINGFENRINTGWNELSNDLFSNQSYQGKTSCLVKANSYSNTFELNLDSVHFDSLKVKAQCWIKALNYKNTNKIACCISIDSVSKNRLWINNSIDSRMIDNTRWNLTFINAKFKNEKRKYVLKFYIWNQSDNDIYMDDALITIYDCKKK